MLKEIPTWFPEARLNYAENILSRDDDSVACTESNELGHVRHCSFRELRERVRVVASALTSSGVGIGDRVAGEAISMVKVVLNNDCTAIVVNSATAVVLALAATSIGAIFSSTSTDLGASVSTTSSFD